ncbi:hypothetical protein ACSLVQ_29150, partial [Klebsiella pneumoniae]|uniref:hypothetical protein n=1 Tax=Klebsiella pneumoniae TaxID=573 RepID=UPI003EDF6A2B
VGVFGFVFVGGVVCVVVDGVGLVGVGGGVVGGVVLVVVFWGGVGGWFFMVVGLGLWCWEM